MLFDQLSVRRQQALRQLVDIEEAGVKNLLRVWAIGAPDELGKEADLGAELEPGHQCDWLG